MPNKLLKQGAGIFTVGGGVPVLNSISLPEISVSSLGSAIEGEASTFRITASFAMVETLAINIDYATSNGTALASTDYTATTGTAVISPGNNYVDVVVPTIFRSGAQSARSFSFTISNARLDDDTEVTITTDVATGSISELPESLTISCPTVTAQVSPDGNSVVVTWADAAVSAGQEPYTVEYTVGGSPVESGDSFAVGSYTVVVNASDSSTPTARTGTCQFSFTVVEGSSGVISELSTSHPRLGVSDFGALRTRLLNASYGERAYLQTLLTDMSTRLTIPVTNPYVPTGTSAQRRDRQTTLQWGAVNCAFIATLDPAELRTAGLTTPGFTTDSGRVLTSSYTSADIAAVAYDLMTQYEATVRVAGVHTAMTTITALAQGRTAGAFTVDVQHSFAGNANTEAMIAAVSLTYDWCYNHWDSAKRLVFTDAIATAYTTPIYESASSAVRRPADSSFANTGTNLSIGSEGGWIVGNQQVWDYGWRPLLYISVLNDPEFGTQAFQETVWETAGPWMDRIAREVKAYSNGAGHHAQEGMISYGSDAYTAILFMAAISRPAYVFDDPWEQAEGNLTQIVDAVAHMRMENERSEGEFPHVANSQSQRDTLKDEYNATLLYLGASICDYWGFTDQAVKNRWLAADLGVGTPVYENHTTRRFYNAVHRYGLLYPYRHIATTTPTSWYNEHGPFIMFGNPAVRDEPQVMIKDIPIRYPGSGGHPDTHACNFALSCGGLLVNAHAPNGKAGPMALPTNPVIPNKLYRGNTTYLLNSSTHLPFDIRGNVPNSEWPAPHNNVYTTRRLKKYLTDPEAAYVLTSFKDAYAYQFASSTNINVALRAYVYIKDIGLFITYDVLEGIPATALAYNTTWVTAQPTWIGGTQAAAGTSPNGFVYWRTSTNATGWEVVNDSGTDIVSTVGQDILFSQKRTHAKMYVTPVLPASKTMHANGGSDWNGATPIFYQFQRMNSDGTPTTFISASYTPTTEQIAEDAQRMVAWGRISTEGTGTDQEYLNVYQFGHSNPGDPYYVGTRVSPTLLTVTGGSIAALHYPHGTTPWVILFPRTNAALATEVTYNFTVPTPVATKLFFTGLPVSTGVSVTGVQSGGNVTVTIATGAGFTTTSQGTLKVTVATNGSIT